MGRRAPREVQKHDECKSTGIKAQEEKEIGIQKWENSPLAGETETRFSEGTGTGHGFGGISTFLYEPSSLYGPR